MDSFTNQDYYTLLGVNKNASPGEIKAAFKKLALKYHPDVYKGDDAHERMRLLLIAYQTLNDPAERKEYDTRRFGHATSAQRAGSTRVQSEVSPRARRDRQRHYDFPEFQPDQTTHVDLIDISYALASHEAQVLRIDGMLRGMAPQADGGAYFCHRCHHRWSVKSSNQPRFCPKCQASDWPEYLLLRCVHCSAVFESEQIRYEIGSYAYDKRHLAGLCPPYELFPLCPYCGVAHWCPAEEIRVQALRKRAAQQARLRLVWIGVAVVMVMVGAVVLSILK